MIKSVNIANAHARVGTKTKEQQLSNLELVHIKGNTIHLSITMRYSGLLIRCISLHSPFRVSQCFFPATIPLDIKGEILHIVTRLRSRPKFIILMYNDVNDYTCIPTFRIRWVRRTLDGYFVADLSQKRQKQTGSFNRR